MNRVGSFQALAPPADGGPAPTLLIAACLADAVDAPIALRSWTTHEARPLKTPLLIHLSTPSF